MKNYKKLIIIVVAGLLVVGFLKDQIIKAAITSVGSSIVGAPIEIGSFSLGLISQKVQIKNLKLYNPPGFPKEPLIDFPEIRVDYDLLSLIAGKIHVPVIVVNMKEMVVVRNQKGKLNVDSLKIVEEQKNKKADKSEEKKSPADLKFKIDLMKLNIEKVVFKDFSKGGTEPEVQAYDVGLKDKKFENITSVEQMATLIMVQGLGPTAIKSAGVYAAATILGVGFLPAGIVGALIGKDDSTVLFSQPIEKVYAKALEMMKQKGEIKSEDQANGMIKAKFQGADVTIKVSKDVDRKVEVSVSARQMMLPKPEIAAGVIYQLQEVLK